jgi:hypothetical protein
MSMGNYRFITHVSAAKADEIGDLALRDDAIACEFGTNIVRDLLTSAPSEHVGWTLEIREGTRAVATIPFKTDALCDQ